MNFVRIEGYSKYVIHPCGTILRIFKNHTRELKHLKDRDGYMKLCLSENNKQKDFRVHRLLGLHFIKNDDPENKIEIDHNDDIRDNNKIENLEWVTPSENLRRRKFKDRTAEITKGGIRKTKYAWRWQYLMKGKSKSKNMKNLKDLEKYRDDILKITPPQLSHT
tara:strand:- start:33 stop:524 length:492 start_codon:yes stop_codon:yes gene_type:complete